MSDNQELFHNRENLSPIDIYKIQKLYNCKVITIPKIKINEGGLEDVLVKTAKINKRFKLEASLREISNDLMDKYLKKNYETCGITISVLYKMINDFMFEYRYIFSTTLSPEPAYLPPIKLIHL